MSKWTAILVGIGLLVGAGQTPLVAGGTVTGKVVLKGAAPAAQKLAIDKDPNVCGTEQLSEELVVGPGQGIRYAVVRLIGAAGTADTAKPVAIQQKGCKFAPHVVVLPKGGTLDIMNEDGLLHNLHSHSTANREFNKAQPGFLKKVSQKFPEAEVVKLTCDVHTWMNGWLVVADEAFIAITDETGSFKLPDVPPGSYKLEVWQEKLGKQTKDVTVKEGADSSVNFELAAGS
jgi:plastocyanin